MIVGLYGVKQTFEIVMIRSEQLNKSYSRIKYIVAECVLSRAYVSLCCTMSH